MGIDIIIIPTHDIGVKCKGWEIPAPFLPQSTVICSPASCDPPINSRLGGAQQLAGLYMSSATELVRPQGRAQEKGRLRLTSGSGFIFNPNAQIRFGFEEHFVRSL